jgi:putative membrane-bound dehydrogenase-like protein
MNRIPRPLAAACLAISTAAMFAAAIPSAHSAEPRPLRVLFFDPQAAEQSKAGVLRVAMEQLGRDAIYFDYFTPSSGLSEKMAGHYDVAMVLGGGQTDVTPALSALKAKQRVVTVKDNDAPAAIRSTILATVDPAAKSDWEKFLAQREPEVREKNPLVANYEKRPEAITFQQPFNVKGAMERTQVPADCRLELYASDPEIGKPIAFAWDARGRLWIAATSDYPHGVTEDGVGHDKIIICEDTKGTGRADKFTVFADKLNLPTGIVFARGGVIIAQPPKLLFLKDSTGGDHADVREVLIDGWGIRDTHAQASNLHLGYDNWLYGCVGYSGFKGTVGGKPFEFSMGTYRFKADGSALEFLHQFTNNSWGQSANDAGDQFGGTANGAPIFFGGIPRSVAPAGVNVMTAKKINVVEQVRAITPNYRQVDVFGTDERGAHWGGYTAAAGSSFIYSSKLPARFQGKAMVCEPTMKVVELLDVQPDGAGWKALDAMPIFASSDEWTSPVYAEVGPDGAVWVADWQNFIIQHNPTPSVARGGFEAKTGAGGAHENALRDHNRGRIYRIVARDTPAVMPKPLAGAPTAELVAALNSDTQYWRLLAQQLIVDGKKSDAAPALKQLVIANDGSNGAIHALWALQGLGALDADTHKAALLAKDARLRRNAVRALGSDAAAQALFFGSGVVGDVDLHTRLAAFVKLAEFPTTPEIKTLVGKLAGDSVVNGDEWLAEAAKMLAKKHKANAYKEGPNLLVNGDLEKLGADGLPEGWKRRDYGGDAKTKGNKGAEWKIVADAHGGKNALLCITRDEGDTSLFQEVAIKPHTMYRLAGWVKTHALKGKVSFNDHLGRAETEKLTARESGWVEVETVFDSRERTTASINILHVAKGDGYFDDVRLCELMPIASEAKIAAGNAERGKKIFWEHPVAACKNCHMLGGVGSTVGPPLDGIAARQNAAYIRESLLEPNKVLAKGYEKLGVSPMPPMGLILKPQEIADIEAFIQTLKQPAK